MNTEERRGAAQGILVAEDSKAQAHMLTEILKRGGYPVCAVENGLEGLYKLMEMRPRLIISDVWMPKMNGYQFCHAVKQDSNLHDIPVILLTSMSDTKDIIEGLEAGADYYLTKPYDEKFLLSMIEAIFKDGSMNGERNDGDVKAVVKITTGGENRTVSVEPQKIVNTLLATYENLLHQNRNLLQTKLELRTLNSHLEERVREKTHVLEEEVAERRKTSDALAESLKNLRKTLDGTVRALATTLEMRDPYTGGHQRRVAQLACALARELGFSEERLEGMEVMGFLHDLGKIVVPAEILSKPGGLNELEFNMIKAHSQVGYDIIKGIEFPWPVNTTVLQHHERLNGSGYPAGLSGDEIIFEARILAVADVVESMASHRPYRAALGIEIALTEIVNNRGILYDPEVVDACLVLFKERNFKLQL